MEVNQKCRVWPDLFKVCVVDLLRPEADCWMDEGRQLSHRESEMMMEHVNISITQDKFIVSV